MAGTRRRSHRVRRLAAGDPTEEILASCAVRSNACARSRIRAFAMGMLGPDALKPPDTAQLFDWLTDRSGASNGLRR
jgi:hypothetical protein